MSAAIRTLAVVAGLAVAAAAQDKPAAVEPLAVEPVADGIYMLVGDGGNIGVSVGDDGMLMIDDKFAPLADRIRAALAGLSDGKLAFLLNTHYHGDHTGGNESFGHHTPILAHHNVRARLGDEPAPALPVITFGEGLSIHFNGQEIRAVHYPNAHTDGDAAIFFDGANVVHMGDILFHRLFPYVDLDAGGSVQGVVDAIESILAQTDADTRFIAGHGPVARAADLRLHLRMIAETQAVVEAGVAAGKSLAQLQAEGLPAEWADWSWAFISTERWIETLHRTATQ